MEFVRRRDELDTDSYSSFEYDYPVGTSYDAEGRKTASRTTRDGGATWDETSWTYDRRSGLNTAKQYADGSSVTRTYTDEGRPVRTTWARGSWRENAYDTRGLLSGVSHSSPATTPDVAFTHNAAGLVATASCGTMVSTAYTYDSHLNCTEEVPTSCLRLPSE